MRLELLGIGSAKNRQLKANLEEALRQLELDVPIEEVRDIDQLLQYDISGIPALAVNGKVVFQRVVPDVEDIKIVLRVLLKKDQAQNRIKEILIPIDFSETAENALQFGLELAEVLQTDMKVVHVHQSRREIPNTMQLDNADGGAYKKRLMKALCERLTRAREKNGLNTSALRKVETEIINGNPVEEICRLSKAPNRIIVMGTTGEGGLFGRWFGSISSQVARNATCPVLLIPNRVRFKGFGRVIYGSQHHPSEEKVLPQLVDFANPFGAALYFAHILENANSNYEIVSAADDQVFQQNGLTLKLSTIESSNVVSGLSRFAEETKADLIVMATTQRNFIEDLFHKSATKKMIFNTRIPLMVLHY